jgi:hypothetical protein
MFPLSLVTPLGRKPRLTDAPHPLRATAQVTARHVSSSARRCARAEVPSCRGKLCLPVVSDQPTAKHYYGAGLNWGPNSPLLSVFRPTRGCFWVGARRGRLNDASSVRAAGAWRAGLDDRDHLDDVGQGVAASIPSGVADGHHACVRQRCMTPLRSRWLLTGLSEPQARALHRATGQTEAAWLLLTDWNAPKWANVKEWRNTQLAMCRHACLASCWTPQARRCCPPHEQP